MLLLHAPLVSPLLLLVLVLLLPALAIYLLCQVLLDMKLFIVPYPFKMVPIQNRVGGIIIQRARVYLLDCAH